MSLLVSGGIFAGSLAIVSDAAHLLTDFASFLISLLALYLASRRATKKLSFGWYRAGMQLASKLPKWYMSHVVRKPVFGFPTKSDTNQAV